MKRSARIAITAVAASSTLTGVGVALASAPRAATPIIAAPAKSADIDAGYRAALAGALHQLQSQVGTLRSELSAAKRELAAARAAADAAARRSASPAHPKVAPRRVIYVQTPAAPAAAPKTHTTTGASTTSSDDSAEPND